MQMTDPAGALILMSAVSTLLLIVVITTITESYKKRQPIDSPHGDTSSEVRDSLTSTPPTPVGSNVTATYTYIILSKKK